jgi:hypothetical protein
LTKEKSSRINVYGAYDEGFQSVSMMIGKEFPFIISSPVTFESYLPFLEFFLIYATLASLVIFSPNIYMKFKAKMEKSYLGYTASNIQDDIRMAFNTLNDKDWNTKSVLSSDLWDSTEYNIKTRIFKNYDDYRHINEFYKKLKERDSEFSQKQINEAKVEEYNLKCLDLATMAIGIVDWTKSHTSLNSVFVRKMLNVLIVA